ncbi:hypothetical protein [Roseivirga sp.]|uniref:hypothetical protein n=1 Tax=Roseivirga sp. TaxID=1964215 RepID=UPI003B8DC39E
MEKRFFKYLLIILVLNVLLTFIILVNGFNDGNSELDDSVNNLLMIVLKYILGFPFGLLFSVGFDYGIFILVPFNAASQFYGFIYLKRLLTKLNKKGHDTDLIL